jgi:hypothetical protein
MRIFVWSAVRIWPPGWNVMACTADSWPVRLAMSLPESTSPIRPAHECCPHKSSPVRNASVPRCCRGAS